MATTKLKTNRFSSLLGKNGIFNVFVRLKSLRNLQEKKKFSSRIKNKTKVMLQKTFFFFLPTNPIWKSENDA